VHILPYERGHFRTGRVFLLGAFTALLIAVGMLGFEAFAPRFTSTTSVVSRLDRRIFDDLRASLAVPAGWSVVEDRYGVSFYSGDREGRASVRGFRAEPVEASFKTVKEQVAETNTDRYPGHVLLGTARGRTRSGEDAFKAVLAADGLRLEQWWIEHDKRMLRLEFWARLADDEASVVNDRIVKSLELR
jgi:hypothetical protein